MGEVRRKCVKCGGARANMVFRATGTLPPGARWELYPEGYPRDVLELRCLSCGYDWDEECKDAKTKEA